MVLFSKPQPAHTSKREFIITLLVIVYVVSSSSSMLNLSPLKCPGSFTMPSGLSIPSAYLSKPQLEVLGKAESNTSRSGDDVILCNVVPILLIDDPSGIIDSLGGNTLSSSNSIKNPLSRRDEGIYDNLPYSWHVKSAGKKDLYDALARRRPKSTVDNFAAFDACTREILGLQITGLIVEVHDRYTNGGVVLGGAAVIAQTSSAERYTLTPQNTKLPGKVAAEENLAVVVNIHLDELIGFSTALNMDVFMKKSLFEAVGVDASLHCESSRQSGEATKTGYSALGKIQQPRISISAPISFHPGGSNPSFSWSRTGVAVRGNNQLRDEDETEPAWDIFNPKRFLSMPTAEKRAVLRASGVRRLPRPRLGATPLDALLLDKMDAAVRAEVRRLSGGSFGAPARVSGDGTQSSGDATSNNNDIADLIAGRELDEGSKTSTGGSGGSTSSRDSIRNADVQSSFSETFSGIADTDIVSSGNSRQELLEQMGAALQRGDLGTAEQLREQFATKTRLRADPTQDKGAYDSYLDQDDWYEAARKRAMGSGTSGSSSKG